MYTRVGIYPTGYIRGEGVELSRFHYQMQQVLLMICRIHARSAEREKGILRRMANVSLVLDRCSHLLGNVEL